MWATLLQQQPLLAASNVTGDVCLQLFEHFALCTSDDVCMQLFETPRFVRLSCPTCLCSVVSVLFLIALKATL